MKTVKAVFFLLFLFQLTPKVQSQPYPTEITFVRQGVKRMVLDEAQSIHLAGIEPGNIIGMSAMHPVRHYTDAHPDISVKNQALAVESNQESTSSIWFGGFNPYATYSIDLLSSLGMGEIGFEFSQEAAKDRFILTVGFNDMSLLDVKLRVIRESKVVVEEPVSINLSGEEQLRGKIILQMLGSGLVLYLQDEGLPKVIGQSDFSNYMDLREKRYIHSFQSRLYTHLSNGEVQINWVTMALNPGVGLADIRAITYENGDPLLDRGRLWYTMTMRGRALPHHVQGVFSMDPTVFDIRFEGVILFDHHDGLLRNEVASHIFYDRNDSVWRGLTTGFSSFANPDKEKKQLLAVESKRDPRFGFSVMEAVPFGVVGDIEDPHVLFDAEANKWRMLTCENQGEGYKAIVLESDHWNKDYKKIAGPVPFNSTGTSIQRIGDQLYCFSGSSERKVFIYTYPDLKEAGVLQMDLPPWDEESGTRVWPNVVQLPEEYPFRYVALMMDRFNYPGMVGANWSYGAIYLYHGVVRY